jgi:hypothetical protein
MSLLLLLLLTAKKALIAVFYTFAVFYTLASVYPSDSCLCCLQTVMRFGGAAVTATSHKLSTVNCHLAAVLAETDLASSCINLSTCGSKLAAVT